MASGGCGERARGFRQRYAGVFSRGRTIKGAWEGLAEGSQTRAARWCLTVGFAGEFSAVG